MREAVTSLGAKRRATQEVLCKCFVVIFSSSSLSSHFLIFHSALFCFPSSAGESCDVLLSSPSQMPASPSRPCSCSPPLPTPTPPLPLQYSSLPAPLPRVPLLRPLLAPFKILQRCLSDDVHAVSKLKLQMLQQNSIHTHFT